MCVFFIHLSVDKHLGDDNRIPERHRQPYVHCSIIHTSQDRETNHLPIRGLTLNTSLNSSEFQCLLYSAVDT